MGSLPDSKYIIQTDGYWFVEAHDVDPSKGYITVSAKGIANGLSNEPNDGADFGPDSYNPDRTSGIPYTYTSGIQEAITYIGNLGGGEIRLNDGTYDITNAPFIDTLWEAGDMPTPGYTSNVETYCQLVLPTVPINATQSKPVMNISIVGNRASRPGVEGGQAPTLSSGGAIIYSQANPTEQGRFILGTVLPSAKVGHGPYPSNVSLYLDGVTFMTKAGSNMGGILSYLIISLTGGMFYITNDSTSTFISSANINQNAALFDGNGTSSAWQWREMIGIQGYQYGWFGGGAHVGIGKLMVDMCVYGMLQFWDGYYSNFVGDYDVQNTKYFISTEPNGNPSPITTLVVANIVSGDQQTSGYSYDYEYVFYDLSNSTYIGGINLQATLSMYNPSYIPAYSITQYSMVNITHIGLLPAYTTPAVPASGTPQSNTNPFPVNVYLYGGTVTVIDYTPSGGSATQVGTLGPATVRLNPGDSITLTYSAAPTWNWVAV